jgi:hypothetical protein
MRWRLEEIAKKEERMGKKVWISYGEIDDQWWRWDEVQEVLRDRKGDIKVEGREKCKKKRKEGAEQK